MLPSPGKVLMFCGSSGGSVEDCVQWAVDTLCVGKDSPSLRILAGLAPPFYSFEVRAYATKALKELGIGIPTEKNAISVYAWYLIKDILADAACMQDRLSALGDLCAGKDYPKEIYDFYLLRWAFADLQDSEVQFYWDEADRNNIQEIILARCHEWLVEYENKET
ncbi:MAG: hypothetical protein AAGI45_04080 [Cyanobacteria bacterium P01_H01_bin.26]